MQCARLSVAMATAGVERGLHAASCWQGTLCRLNEVCASRHLSDRQVDGSLSATSTACPCSSAGYQRATLAAAACQLT